MSENFKKKKARATNFTPTETDLLSELAVKYAGVVESKKSDVITWREKEEKWAMITNEFNNANVGVPRTIQSLKTKYDTLKKELRKKAAYNKLEMYRTGGGVNKGIPFTPSEEKIYSIISLSVEGLPGRHDNDNSNFKSSCNQNEDIILKIPNLSLEQNVEVETEHEIAEIDNNIEVPYIQTGNLQSVTVPLEDGTQTFNSSIESCTASTSHETPSTSTRNSWSKWNPSNLKKSVSKSLQVKRNNKLSRPQVTEKVSILAGAKKKLLDLQYEYLQLEMNFKRKEEELKVKKAEEELHSAQLDVEIKTIEKRIKEETLKKNNVFRP